jgi:hypothetical protein
MNALVMADIFESPKKNISPTYATHYLDYKGMVSTEYMTNFIESEAQVAIIHDPQLQLDFLHLSIAPKHLTVEYYDPKDQYYCNFVLDVSLRKGENIIFQQNKNFPMYFDKERYSFIQKNGIALEDSIPVVAGEFKLIILIQNSVSKEFSVYEQEMTIPEDTAEAHLVGPFLGYGFEDYQSSVSIPFKIGNKKIVIDPKSTFSASDDIFVIFNTMNVTESLWKEGKVRMRISSVGQGKIPPKVWTIDLNDFPYQRVISVDQILNAGELSPDYYEMRLILTGSGDDILDEKVEHFIVSAVKNIAHPVAHAKGFSLADSFMFYYAQANQFDKLGKIQRAEESYEKAFGLNPEYDEGLIEYANFLFKISKFNKILEVIEHISEDEVAKFEYLLLKGKAFMGLSRYGEAIKNLVDANKIYNSHLGLLNSLGFCYYKIGNREEALKALNSSLRLDPNQTEVKKLIAMIEENVPSNESLGGQ